MKSACICVLVLIASGCVAPTNWEKPFGSEEQYQADSAACYAATPKNGWLGHAVGASPTLTSAMEQAYADCMSGRGYLSDR